jgi:hypothetical protein
LLRYHSDGYRTNQNLGHPLHGQYPDQSTVGLQAIANPSHGVDLLTVCGPAVILAPRGTCIASIALPWSMCDTSNPACMRSTHEARLAGAQTGCPADPVEDETQRVHLVLEHGPSCGLHGNHDLTLAVLILSEALVPKENILAFPKMFTYCP